MKIYISLGSGCAIAYQYQERGRIFALPFDWVTIPKFSSIIKILENNFNNFLDFKIKKISNSHPYFEDHFDENGKLSTFIVENEYNITFPHDFITEKSFEEQISSVREKYLRRINRFYSLVSDQNNEIIFIRDEHNPKNINDEILKQFFEIFNFKLILICHKFSFTTNLENIQIISDYEEFDNWRRPNVVWDKIFT
jgi:hypothetical protein